jgi:sulfide:quinone oxidoreductase
MSKSISHQIVIIGGGAAGITVASQLKNKDSNLDIVIIEPSDNHYYQPAWTLVGAGAYQFEDTVKSEQELIPSGVKWLKDFAENIDPDQNLVTTKNGTQINYNYLIVCTGISPNWDSIKGFKEALGKDGVTTNYIKDYAPYTWELIKNFQGGNAVFTFPAGAIKCPGAPQKIMYLADEAFRRQGVRNKTKIIYGNATGKMFGVPTYCTPLEKIVEGKNIDVRYFHNLVEIKPESKEAIFQVTKENSTEEVAIKYDLLHVSPSMFPPEFIRNSKIAGAGGFVDVNKDTLQHNVYSNVFSLGDASSLPTSKTAAAIRKEAPVLVANLLSVMKQEKLNSIYNGYACCPLVTGYGKTIMAEFDYDKKPLPSFPLDPAQERFSMWLIKRHVLPWLYWNRMLKGKPFEPDSWRFLLPR